MLHFNHSKTSSEATRFNKINTPLLIAAGYFLWEKKILYAKLDFYLQTKASNCTSMELLANLAFNLKKNRIVEGMY
jgi:hypothetical protein